MRDRSKSWSCLVAPAHVVGAQALVRPGVLEVVSFLDLPKHEYKLLRPDLRDTYAMQARTPCTRALGIACLSLARHQATRAAQGARGRVPLLRGPQVLQYNHALLALWGSDSLLLVVDLDEYLVTSTSPASALQVRVTGISVREESGRGQAAGPPRRWPPTPWAASHPVINPTACRCSRTARRRAGHRSPACRCAWLGALRQAPSGRSSCRR